jgi:phosphatidylglycerophosphatase A
MASGVTEHPESTSIKGISALAALILLIEVVYLQALTFTYSRIFITISSGQTASYLKRIKVQDYS